MIGCLLLACKGMVDKNTELEQQVADLRSELERVKAEALLQREAFVAAAEQGERLREKKKGAALAEKSAVCTAKNQNNKKIAKAVRPRVSALVSDHNWDPETGNGDIFGTSESESNAGDEADVKKEGALTAPVFKCKMMTRASRHRQIGRL